MISGRDSLSFIYILCLSFLDSFDHFTSDIFISSTFNSSNPGEEFTSNNKGPLEERMISTPATFKSMALLLYGDSFLCSWLYYDRSSQGEY
jgi:hypothetical protein